MARFRRASPSGGYPALHRFEQERIVRKALRGATHALVGFRHDARAPRSSMPDPSLQLERYRPPTPGNDVGGGPTHRNVPWRCGITTRMSSTLLDVGAEGVRQADAEALFAEAAAGCDQALAGLYDLEVVTAGRSAREARTSGGTIPTMGLSTAPGAALSGEWPLRCAVRDASRRQPWGECQAALADAVG